MKQINRFIRVLVMLFLFSFTLHAKGTLQIKIQPVFRGKPLILNDKNYVTENGESVTIDEFKFYISTLNLTGLANSFNEKNSAHLINASDSNSLVIKIHDVPSGIYQSLRFNIGLDSITNVSGALGGDLDPTRGMYWAWNTGYINAKLTGNSPSCQTLHNKFEFHIGGYMEPYITIRKITCAIPELIITDKTTTTITLVVDAAKWLTGIHLVSMNNVVAPCKEALRIADNYMTMFEVNQMDETQK